MLYSYTDNSVRIKPVIIYELVQLTNSGFTRPARKRRRFVGHLARSPELMILSDRGKEMISLTPLNFPNR